MDNKILEFNKIYHQALNEVKNENLDTVHPNILDYYKGILSEIIYDILSTKGEESYIYFLKQTPVWLPSENEILTTRERGLKNEIIEIGGKINQLLQRPEKEKIENLKGKKIIKTLKDFQEYSLLSMDELKGKYGGKSAFILYIKNLQVLNKSLGINIPGGVTVLPPSQEILNYILDSVNECFLRPSIYDDEKKHIDLVESKYFSQYKDVIPKKTIHDDESKMFFIDKTIMDLSDFQDKSNSSKIELKSFLVNNYIHWADLDNTIFIDNLGMHLKTINEYSSKHSSITNHPNIKGHYIISFLDGRYELLINSKGEILNKSHNCQSEKYIKTINYLDSNINRILEMKKIADGLEFTSKSKSAQTEFAIGSNRKCFVLQQREFLSYKNSGENMNFQDYGQNKKNYENYPRITLDEIEGYIGPPAVLKLFGCNKVQLGSFDIQKINKTIIKGVEFSGKNESGIGTMGHNSYKFIQAIGNSWRVAEY